MRIIARLDLKQDKIIKGIQLEGLYKVGSANKLSKKYYDEGIDEIFLINNTGSLFKTKIDPFIIKKIRKNKFLPIAVGGGIKSLNDALQLIKNGADKIVINSLISENKKEVKKIIDALGSSSVVGSIQFFKRNGKFVSLKKMARELVSEDLKNTLKLYSNLGIGELLLNDVSRDGTMLGLSNEILEELNDYKNTFPILLSGGFRNLQDLKIFKNKVSGIVISNALFKNKIKIKKLKYFLNKNSS